MAPIEPALENATQRACPHMAVLLNSEDELPSVLAAFYGLGARRDGWLVHRCHRGESDADRAALAAAGLAVGELEAAGELVFAEFDPAEPPETSPEPWRAGLDEALARGRKALWYSRFSVGPDDDVYAGVLAFERAWESCFHDRPVVTLCPYVVGSLTPRQTLERLTTLAEIHDTVLVRGPSGFAPLAQSTERQPA